jgi:hypothetical protein
MSKKMRKITTAFAVMFCAFAFVLRIEGIFLSNGGDCAHIPDCVSPGGDDSGLAVPSLLYGGIYIKMLIREGGIYFFEVQERIAAINKLIEKGADSSTLIKIVDDAYYKAENARIIYSTIVDVALITPLNEVYIEKYKQFDYELFQKSHLLNSEVFKSVSDNLAKGDVQGYWEAMLYNLQDITASLYRVKGKIEKGVIPTWEIYKLNDLVFKTQMAGQYAAMVFVSCNM